MHTGNSSNTVKRRVKKDGGGCEEVLVPIPNSTYDYNRFMGGVDLSDQLLQYHQTRRQTHKYWKTLFYHCVDITVTNSYILHKLSLSGNDRSNYEQKSDHKNFVVDLINELADAGSVVPTVSPGRGRQPRSVRAHHRLAYYATGRKYCVICKENKKYTLADKYCVKCNVALCFTRKRNCFAIWHSPTSYNIHKKYI